MKKTFEYVLGEKSRCSHDSAFLPGSRKFHALNYLYFTYPSLLSWNGRAEFVAAAELLIEKQNFKYCPTKNETFLTSSSVLFLWNNRSSIYQSQTPPQFSTYITPFDPTSFINSYNGTWNLCKDLKIKEYVVGKGQRQLPWCTDPLYDSFPNSTLHVLKLPLSYMKENCYPACCYYVLVLIYSFYPHNRSSSLLEKNK